MAFHPAGIVDALLTLKLGQSQLYGLFFLLGTFAVATLSDLRHMAAQREFFQVWIVFGVAMALLDAHGAWQAAQVGGGPQLLLFGLKWGLIVVLSVLSYDAIGIVFRLARADVAAMAATASLLAPGLVVVFWVLLKVFDLIERPVLAGGEGTYPFMPVVTSATLVILALGFVLAGAALPL